MNVDDVNTLRKTLILKTIVDTGSFRKAAKNLSVSTSAISQSIKSLEKTIGRPMLVRNKDGVIITNEARDLIEKPSLLLRF